MAKIGMEKIYTIQLNKLEFDILSDIVLAEYENRANQGFISDNEVGEALTELRDICLKGDIL